MFWAIFANLILGKLSKRIHHRQHRILVKKWTFLCNLSSEICICIYCITVPVTQHKKSHCHVDLHVTY